MDLKSYRKMKAIHKKIRMLEKNSRKHNETLNEIIHDNSSHLLNRNETISFSPDKKQPFIDKK